MTKIMNQLEQFSLKQLLVVAILKEEESIALYTALFKKSTINPVKKLFKQLLEQEKEHKKFYNQLAKEIDPKNEMSLEERNEYTTYMLNFLEEHRASFDMTVDHIKSVFHALDYAILREKHSILFYTGLKFYVPAQARPTIEDIIKEEMQHAEMLMDLRKKIQAEN